MERSRDLAANNHVMLVYSRPTIKSTRLVSSACEVWVVEAVGSEDGGGPGRRAGVQRLDCGVPKADHFLSWEPTEDSHDIVSSKLAASLCDVSSTTAASFLRASI